MRRTRVGVLLAVIPAGAVVALGGPAGAQGNGITAKSATQIVSAALAASRSASSFRFTGTVMSGGRPLAIDITAGSNGEASGMIGQNGQTIRILKIGSAIYFSADQAFWTANGGAAAAQLFDGRWVQTSTANKDFSSFDSFFGVHSVGSQLFRPVPSAAVLSKGPTATVAGQRVITVTSRRAGRPTGTVYVATTGRPYVVRVAQASGPDQGVITFTGYDRPVRVNAPKDAVNLSQLKSG